MGPAVAAAIAAARTVLGVVTMARPSSASLWVGPVPPGASVLARSLGARDVALGAGFLTALRNDGDARLWVAAGALSDLVDTLSTLGRFRQLPRRWRFAALGASAVAAVAGAAAVACWAERS